MDRRVLLKNLFFIGLGAYVPGIIAARSRMLRAGAVASMHSFKLGVLDMTVVSDGALQPCIWPQCSRIGQRALRRLL